VGLWYPRVSIHGVWAPLTAEGTSQCTNAAAELSNQAHKQTCASLWFRSATGGFSITNYKRLCNDNTSCSCHATTTVGTQVASQNIIGLWSCATAQSAI